MSCYPIGDTYFVGSFEEFKNVLREHEIHTGTRYVYEKGNKLFTKTDIKLSTDLRLHWLDDTPFFHFGRRVYSCHQGRDKNLSTKRKYHMIQEERARFGPIKRYKKKKLSIKIDCPARVSIVRIFRMPEYRIPNLNKKHKLRMASIIKDKIRNEEHVEGEEGYLFNIPTIEDHDTHLVTPISSSDNHLQNVEYTSLERVKTEIIENETDEHYEPEECVENEQIEYVSGHLETVYTDAEIQVDTNEHLEAAYAVVELTESVTHEHLEAAVAVAELTSSVPNEHLEAAVAVAELTDSVPNELTNVNNAVKSEPSKSVSINRQALPLNNHNPVVSRIEPPIKIQRNQKRQLINDCKVTMQSIQSLVWHLEENELQELSINLKDMLELISSQVTNKKHVNQMPLSSSRDNFVLST